jgi:hypothetical protein
MSITIATEARVVEATVGHVLDVALTVTVTRLPALAINEWLATKAQPQPIIRVRNLLLDCLQDDECLAACLHAIYSVAKRIAAQSKLQIDDFRFTRVQGCLAADDLEAQHNGKLLRL